MTRLLFWIAIVILVVTAVRSKLRKMMAPYRDGAGPVPGAGPAAAPPLRRVRDEAEPMACCAACGVYFPASEAVRAQGHDFCCPAHAQQPVPRTPLGKTS